jgi:hypothetical protein
MISEDSFRRRKKIFKVDYSNPLSGLKDYPSARFWNEYQYEVYKWLDENFGENWIWSSPIYTDYTDVYFPRSEDALLFRLRFDSRTTA